MARGPPAPTSSWPRATSPASTPARRSAIRRPAAASTRGRPWISSPLTRTSRPPGSRRSSSPLRTSPRASVPVTTSPLPVEQEGAVDRQPRRIVGAAGRNRGASTGEELFGQPLDPLAGQARDAEDGRSGPDRRRQQLGELDLRQVGLVGDGDVHARQRRHQLGDGEQRAASRCSRVCARTPSSAATTSSSRRAPPRPARALCSEPLVAGDVDEPDLDAVALEVGEAEVEGDAAPLLLRQPVAVDAGERPHQGGLAVVDVTGGADDERAHGAVRRRCPSSATRGRAPAARRARAGRRGRRCRAASCPRRG